MARLSFAVEPENLTIARAGRNGHVQAATLWKGDPSCGPVHGVEEVDRKPVLHVRTAHPKVRPASSSEQLGKDIVAHQVVEAGAGRVTVVRSGSEVPIEPLIRPLGPGRIDLAPIEA